MVEHRVRELVHRLVDVQPGHFLIRPLTREVKDICAALVSRAGGQVRQAYGFGLQVLPGGLYEPRWRWERTFSPRAAGVDQALADSAMWRLVMPFLVRRPTPTEVAGLDIQAGAVVYLGPFPCVHKALLSMNEWLLTEGRRALYPYRVGQRPCRREVVRRLGLAVVWGPPVPAWKHVRVSCDASTSLSLAEQLDDCEGEGTLHFHGSVDDAIHELAILACARLPHMYPDATVAAYHLAPLVDSHETSVWSWFPEKYLNT
jgi:hypothetical protein